MNLTRPRRNLCGQIVHDLGCQIISGGVQPGEALPQELTLCETMGVSRTVIREAIKSLAAKGLVESKPKRGTTVRSPKHWNYLDAEVLEWQTQGNSRGKFLLHLAEFRQTIEPAAASMAAQRATEEDIAMIFGAFEKMDQSADDIESFLVADMNFHTEILHAAKNSFFAPVANVISAALRCSLEITNRQESDNRQSVPLHRAVADAIAEHRSDDARDAMLHLLSDATERIENSLLEDNDR